MGADIWTVAEAKAKFSEVIEKAQSDGPQTVTRNGRTAVVIVALTNGNGRRSGSAIWLNSSRVAAARIGNDGQAHQGPSAQSCPMNFCSTPTWCRSGSSRIPMPA